MPIRKKKSIRLLVIVVIIVAVTITVTLKWADVNNEYKPRLQQHLKNAFSGSGNANVREEVLYISRNQDAVNNMRHVMDQLGLDVYNLIPWYSPSNRPPCYSNGECSTMFTALCRKYKYIIINEIASDGYGYINSGCSAKIIFELSNRFDAYVLDDSIQEYHVKFGTSLVNENKDIALVLQNSYENYYACKKGIHFPYYHILRSTGYVDGISYEEVAGTKKENVIAIVEKTRQDSLIAKMELKKRDIKYEMIAWQNGHPKHLAKYKAQLILPNQLTAPKMMECFRYGVVIMIPSEPLFRELIKETGQYSFDAMDVMAIDDGLEKYSDWYSDDFEDLFVFFNSWDDIHGLMHSVDFDKVREKARAFAEAQEQSIIEQWDEILNKDPDDQKHLIHHKKPICKSDLGHFYNYS